MTLIAHVDRIFHVSHEPFHRFESEWNWLKLHTTMWLKTDNVTSTI